MAPVSLLDQEPLLHPGRFTFTAAGSDALLRKNLRAPTDTAEQQNPAIAEDMPPEVPTRQGVLDRFALLLAVVFVPFARSEANRMRRFHADAVADLQTVLSPARVGVATTGGGGGGATHFLAAPARGRPVWLTCDFVERPFARLALAETLFAQAETEYRSDAAADAALPALPMIAGEQPGDWPRQGFEFSTHGLRAAQTYRQVLDLYAGAGGYVERVQNGRDELAQGAGSPGAASFHTVGKTVTLPASGGGTATVESATASLPGLLRTKAPAESWLRLAPKAAGRPVSETNPKVYALLLHTQARLEQVKHNFNYLGYADDYVPPWRFQFLLDRARYFAEHAKSTERDYLNFLANTEHEEYQELSASQAVEMEKANVRIETARVEQAQDEVNVAVAASTLAQTHAQNAQQAADDYRDFKAKADEADIESRVDSFLGEGLNIIIDVGTKNYVGLAQQGLGLFDNASAGQAHFEAGIMQRHVELQNLRRTAQEALLAQDEAETRLQTTKAGWVVAGLQRQASLLRHEFAVQNLSFLRGRQLDSEQWLRLANSIREVSETYLRYAVQLAFLAEQAYEFEADKRINVIRFDYDSSDVESFLAADFLLRDLDTIEQDLVGVQQQRQQQVRYVLSLASEFPQALQDLRDSGRVSFSLSVEQIERRFPGLYNARIGSVDVLPVALLDPNRATVQLRHLGFGQVRLKANPDTVTGQGSTSVLNVNDVPIPPDGWLPQLVQDWPIKIRLSEPQTNLYSGLTRSDAAAAFPVATAGDRNAFEGLPAASAWTIDLSSAQTAIVPGTLADVLLTFALSGYHDQDLAAVVASAPPQPFAATTSLSARSLFPDAFYSLVNEGTAAWDVTDHLLAAGGSSGALRNLAVRLTVDAQETELGRCYSRYGVTLEIPATGGNVRVLDVLPDVTVTPNGRSLGCAFNGPVHAQVTWDFGDGSVPSRERSVTHTYGKSGRYDLRIQLVQDGRLAEYRARAVVSDSHPVTSPLIEVPHITVGATNAAAGTVDLHVSLAPGSNDTALDCAIGPVSASSTTGSLVLPGIARGGRVVMRFLATRTLSGRLYSRQRFLPEEAVALTRLRASTNRTFDGSSETTTHSNSLTTHIFGTHPSQSALSPVDRWTLTLPLSDNPCFLAVSSADIAEFDGREIADAVLSLEFQAGRG